MPRPRTITSWTPARRPSRPKTPSCLRLRPPNDGDRNCATCGRAVAELAEVVRAPAVSHPGRGDPARVVRARGEDAKAQAPRDRDRSRAVRGRPVTEVPEKVGAPTVGRSGRRDPAGVVPARREDPEAEAYGDGDRRDAAAAGVGVRRTIIRPARGTVAKLAVKVGTPAVLGPGAR